MIIILFFKVKQYVWNDSGHLYAIDITNEFVQY